MALICIRMRICNDPINSNAKVMLLLLCRVVEKDYGLFAFLLISGLLHALLLILQLHYFQYGT